MIGAARKPETNQPRELTSPVLLPQDPTVCQTLNHRNIPPPFQDNPSPEEKETIRTRQANTPRGRYLLIFHP
jgi:hypothetical protein